MNQPNTAVTTENTIPEDLKILIERKKATAFVAGYKATDSEALGLILSEYFSYDGKEVLKTTYAALEDSNWHAENLKIERMINAQPKGRKSAIEKGAEVEVCFEGKVMQEPAGEFVNVQYRMKDGFYYNVFVPAGFITVQKGA